MRKIALTLTLLAALLLPAAARAQTGVAFESVVVQLWPEYDQPDMLVICDFVVASGTALPAEVTVRIPIAAGEPYVVAVGPTPNTVVDEGVEFSTRTAGDWVEVTVALPEGSPAFRVEYYDPGLARDGATRTYRYEWPGDYAAESFFVSFQEPAGGHDTALTPALSGAVQADNGLTYFEGDVGPLQAGQAYTLEIEYQKDTEALTISGSPVQPAGPVEQNTGIDWNKVLPWVLGGLGLLLIGGGVSAFFFGQGGSRRLLRAERKRRAAAQAESGEPVYCHQCGNRARPGDAFCRSCGSRLRREE